MITEPAVTGSSGVTRDSLTVASWTVVSRITGALRVLAIAAVLGPTALGNSFQLTNALPNLIYYGFLAGSLMSTVLVPVLVARVDRGEVEATARIAGGLMGSAMVLLTVVAPIAVVLLPEALWLATQGRTTPSSADQVDLARVLIVMMIPQIFGYLVIGTCGAVMHARQRFALTAAVPAVENCALIGVLLLAAASYGTGDGGSVPAGELVLLGVGSTVAVAMAATLQWFGARACGVRLRPRWGWRDSEVRTAVHRAVPALIQSGLVATQVLVILLLSARVAGGTVAMQIALNFIALPVAIVGTPIALALLPRLARLRQRGASRDFADAFVRGTAVVLFVTAPVAGLYFALALPIAEVVTVGRMDDFEAQLLVTFALGAAAGGLIGQSVFIVATQAAYAAGRVRTPLLAMAGQAVFCVGGCGIALAVTGPAILIALGAAFSGANLLGALALWGGLRRELTDGRERIVPTLLRVTVATVAVCLAATVVEGELTIGSGWIEDLMDVLVAGIVGVVLYLGIQRLLHAPELRRLGDTIRRSANDQGGGS